MGNLQIFQAKFHKKYVKSQEETGWKHQIKDFIGPF